MTKDNRLFMFLYFCIYGWLKNSIIKQIKRNPFSNLLIDKFMQAPAEYNSWHRVTVI